MGAAFCGFRKLCFVAQNRHCPHAVLGIEFDNAVRKPPIKFALLRLDNAPPFVKSAQVTPRDFTRAICLSAYCKMWGEFLAWNHLIPFMPIGESAVATGGGFGCSEGGAESAIVDNRSTSRQKRIASVRSEDMLVKGGYAFRLAAWTHRLP
jgi:hypothetical protein